MITPDKLTTYFQIIIALDKKSKREGIKLSKLLAVKRKDDKLDRLSRLKRNKSCYFCGFDYAIHKHHIVDRNWGGSNTEDNLLGLCPNHHWMIHHCGWRLIYWKGYFFLVYKEKWSRLIFPNKIQHGFKKKNPKIMFKEALGKIDKNSLLKKDVRGVEKFEKRKKKG